MSKKTKTETAPWKPAQAPILAAQSNLSGVVNAQQPHLDQIASQIQGYLPDYGTRAFSPDPATTAAQGYDTNVLGGKFLDAGNPYINQMIGQTNNDVADQVNSRFGMAGATGGIQNQDLLSRNLANNENALRYSNYTDERARMAAAAGQTPALYASEFAGAQPYMQAASGSASIPLMGATALADGTSNLLGKYSTTTTTPGLGAMLMNAATAAAEAYAKSGGSDRRLKVDIEKVGELSDGLGLYDWTYHCGGPRYRGVMADEVAELRPWALGPDLPGGFATVNYAAL